MVRIPTRDGEEIRVERSTFKEKEYINVRKWFDSNDGWAPTKKGITFPVEFTRQVGQAILDLV